MQEKGTPAKYQPCGAVPTAAPFLSPSNRPLVCGRFSFFIKTQYFLIWGVRNLKSVDLRHFHRGMKPHAHHGYIHSENDGPKKATGLSAKERKMVDLVLKLWYNNNGKS